MVDATASIQVNSMEIGSQGSPTTFLMDYRLFLIRMMSCWIERPALVTNSEKNEYRSHIDTRLSL